MKGAACAAQSVADRRLRSVACVCVRSQGWGARLGAKRCASQLTPFFDRAYNFRRNITI